MKMLLKEYVRLLVEQDNDSFKTKQGQPITFKVEEDSERNRDSDSKWVVHTLTAFVDNQEVGYLKMSYIPSESIQNFGLIDYLIQSGKRSLENYEQQPLWKQVETLIFADFGWINGSELENLSEKELLKMKKEKLVHYKQKYQPKFEDFLKFHVDKPLVDYIRVPENQQRNRIGLALYIAGAQWLAKTKGLKLYASGIQSDEAQGAWTFMKKYLSDHIGTEQTGIKDTPSRTFLSYL